MNSRQALDWNNKIHLNNTTSYKVSAYGYFILSDSTNNGSLFVTINGVEIARNAGQPGDWADSLQVQIPVAPNDNIAWFRTCNICYFIPFKS